MDKDYLRLARKYPEDMTNKDWIELVMLKWKHENFPIDIAIEQIIMFAKETMKEES